MTAVPPWLDRQSPQREHSLSRRNFTRAKSPSTLITVPCSSNLSFTYFEFGMQNSRSYPLRSNSFFLNMVFRLQNPYLLLYLPDFMPPPRHSFSIFAEICNSHPTGTSQAPAQTPAIISSNPPRINPRDRIAPTDSDMPIALSLLPVNPQITLFSTLPPSMGNPGRRLKTPNRRLTRKRYINAAGIISATGRDITILISRFSPPARASYDSGPAIATQSSAVASSGSCCIMERPPKRKSSILSIVTP
jgi:hypothetical protein